MSMNNALPWAMPNETVEIIEIMKETAEIIRNCAKFGSLRKELRDQLLDQAHKLDDMARIISGDIVDESLILGIDAVAREKHSVPMAEIMEAIEKHITQFMRRKT